MKLLSLLLLLTSLVGCVKVEPFKEIPAYSVYSILNPSDSVISVFVGRTFKNNEFFSIDSGKVLNNAKIEIRNKNISKSFVFNNSKKNYEALNKDFIKAGETYYLKIIINNEILEGQTTIPEESNLKLDKAEISENSEGQIQVSWNKKTLNDGIYRLEGSVDVMSNVFVLFFWDQDQGIWETKDKLNTSHIINSPLGSFNFLSSSSEAFIKIELVSLDNNYNDFRLKESTFQLRSEFSRIFESPVIFNSNVSNSMGIFGSYTTSSLNFKMIKK